MKILKLLPFLTVTFIFSNAEKSVCQDLKHEFLFEFTAYGGTSIYVGNTLKGTRIIFPFKGGHFEGEKLKGKVLANGGDWGLILDSTTFKIDVRTTLETDDGVKIFISYTGFIHASPEFWDQFWQGQVAQLPPESYYVRANYIFETGSEKYSWLNHTIGIGVGRFIDGGISYKVYVIK